MTTKGEHKDKMPIYKYLMGVNTKWDEIKNRKIRLSGQTFLSPLWLGCRTDWLAKEGEETILLGILKTKPSKTIEKCIVGRVLHWQGDGLDDLTESQNWDGRDLWIIATCNQIFIAILMEETKWNFKLHIYLEASSNNFTDLHGTLASLQYSLNKSPLTG